MRATLLLFLAVGVRARGLANLSLASRSQAAIGDVAAVPAAPAVTAGPEEPETTRHHVASGEEEGLGQKTP